MSFVDFFVKIPILIVQMSIFRITFSFMHSIFRLFILLLFLLSSHLSSSQNYDVFAGLTRKYWHKEVYSKFYINKKLREDSTSFFSEVKKLKIAAEKNFNYELILETEFLKFNYLSSRDYKNFAEELEQFKKQVETTSFNQLKARVRQALGFYYFYETKQYEKTIENFAESYTYIKELSLIELPDKQELVYNIAFVYYHIGYFEAAMNYLNIAENLSNNYYKELPLNIKASKGMILLERGNEKEAEEVFLSVKNQAIRLKLPSWIAISDIQLAQLYFLKSNYHDALLLLNETKKHNYSNWDLKMVVNYHLLKIKIYDKLNESLNVRVEYSVLDKLLLMKNPEEYIDKLEDIIWAKGMTKKHEGKFEESFKFLDSAYVLSIKNNKYRNYELIKKADEKENIDKYLKQKSELNYQRKLSITIFISAVLLIISLLYIAYIILQKQKIKSKQKHLELEIKNQEIKTELNSVSSQLADLTNSLLEKNKKIQFYQDEIASIESKNTLNPKDEERRIQLNLLLSKAILTDDQWNQFKRAFEVVHVQYIDKVKTLLPFLSESELRYLVLLKMNLSSKEIASLLGIKSDSIRMYRLRIRKKHHLNNDTDIENLINDL